MRSLKLLQLNTFLIGGEGVLKLLKEFHKLLYLLEELEELKELLYRESIYS